MIALPRYPKRVGARQALRSRAAAQIRTPLPDKGQYGRSQSGTTCGRFPRSGRMELGSNVILVAYMRNGKRYVIALLNQDFIGK